MGASSSTRCMHRGCRKRAVPFFTLATGLQVAYVPTPTALLRSLDLLKWLKPQYAQATGVSIRLCQKHSSSFFCTLFNAVTLKYGQQAINFMMKQLVYAPMAAQLGFGGAYCADFWKASEQTLLGGAKLHRNRAVASKHRQLQV